MTVDMGPAAQRMADLIDQVPDDLLDGPTPCPAYNLGDLLDHVSGFALAFTAAATKATVPGAPERASGGAALRMMYFCPSSSTSTRFTSAMDPSHLPP